MTERSFDLSYLKPSAAAPSASHSKPVAAEDPSAADVDDDSVFENIRQALHGLQFGEVTITVRNGTVVQIERVARKRQFKC